MYISEYDPSRATLIGITSGNLPDREWQQIYDDVARLVEDNKQNPKDMLVIFIPASDTERPNATQRRKLAELRNKSIPSVRSVSLIVTPSLLLRGVITAINWLVPMRPNEVTLAFNTFDDALAWFTKEIKKPTQYLVQMHQSLIQKMHTRMTLRR